MQHSQSTYDGPLPSSFLPRAPFFTPAPSPNKAWQPSTNVPTPSSPPPSSQHRQVAARDLFLRGKGKPVATASDKILAAVKDLGSQISDLHSEVSSLKKDNRHLCDQLHELQLSVRCLPSRDEVTDEIINNITPELQECLQSTLSRFESTTAHFPGKVVEAIAPHLSNLQAECKRLGQDARPGKPGNESHSQPLHDLLSHVIAKLGAIETVGDSVQTIHNISQIAGDVALCRESLNCLPKITEEMEATAHKSRETLLSIQQSVQGLHHCLDRTPHSSQAIGDANQATATLKIRELLTLILTRQNEMKFLLGRLSALPLALSSSQRQYPTSSFPDFPASSQDESQPVMTTPVSEGHIGRITLSSRESSTQQDSSQSSLADDRPLVGDSLADIFGPKAFIPGPVRATSDRQDTRQGGSRMSVDEAEPPLPVLSYPQAVFSPSPMIEMVSNKKSHKRGRLQKKKQPITAQLSTITRLPLDDSAPGKHAPILSPGDEPRRQTRHSSRIAQNASGTQQSLPHADAESSLASRDTSKDGTAENKECPSQYRKVGQGGGSKAKKRTWDFSSDEN
ncbi:hypothetical protein L198_03456 [Cryptococcus wingfieldii CBS 7118]|uniref:Uncharacterized protein n=1 Tax=Cryptococcus wingfieldii CBS 7118 TaxID=1295528 RepID=A0A1E3JFK5_9TREE|nr:hypothetical protein L198_03456 [Cryptococcus wingfieldii CBS 7118]ODN99612.1 hypothetical protein L198_03456 [Cryptococcus wingfieldii CBS 7118]